MTFWQILLCLFCGVGLIQGLALAAYLFFRDRNYYPPGIFISLTLSGIAFRLSKSFFVFLPVDSPEPGILLGAVGLWSIGPGIYNYLYGAHSTQLSRYAYGHYLPAVLLLIAGIVQWGDYIGTAYYWGILHGMLYLAAGYWFHLRKAAAVEDGAKLLTSIVAGVLVIFTVQAVISGIEIYSIGTVVAVSLLYVFSFKVVRHPAFFNGRTKGRTESTTQAGAISDDLHRLMVSDKIFKQQGLTLAVISAKSGHPSYLISQTINQKHGMNFNEFVNQYRVMEVKRVLEDQEANLTVEAIADEVGFSSTSSFYKAFKKQTGMTPHQYRLQMAAKSEA